MNQQLTTLNPQALEQLKESSQLRLLESFFNHNAADPKSSRRLWANPDQLKNKDFSANILVEGPMEKQGRKLHSWISRHYLLYNGYLAYKERPNSRKIKRVMDLERVKLECIEHQDANKKKTKYGFCFTKNQQSAKIYTTDRELYERFLENLQRMCILTTFEEDYEIEKLIGKGSFGKVYLVKRKSDDKKFAAKMFFKDALLKQSRGKEALINEIGTLRKLDHPGIMKLEKLYETMLGIFLIMELLEGGELFEHLKKKRMFTERDCAIILMRILDSLLYMHSKNIVHRDIKPENLILRSRADEYGIVIADFGLAQCLTETAVYVKCGSPGYCAPEILNCADPVITYDAKCDVFSVGCVFYHL